jgi:hypothetical protein
VRGEQSNHFVELHARQQIDVACDPTRRFGRHPETVRPEE